MFAIWSSVKGNVNCWSKPTDVIERGRNAMIRKNSTVGNDSRNELSIQPKDSETEEPSFRHNRTGNWFYLLEVGDPSRNIIERIFRAASANSCRYSRKITQVLRVQNSEETLERFEKYRENVKTRLKEQYRKHPRILVDGNEQLQFYSTIMKCCTGKGSGACKPRKKSTCVGCRIIQSGFNTANKNIGIRLSTSSEECLVVTNDKNVKKVVIICRVIAGRVVSTVDMDYEEDYDLISVTGSKLNYLIVRNSRAVLPCFAIVLN